MATRDEILASLGFSLDRRFTPGAVYQPVVVDGTTAYVSGCVPLGDDLKLLYPGKVGAAAGGVTLEQAQRAASLCAANVLRLVRQETGGSLDRIARILKVTGFVNSAPDFTEQHLVINGASELFIKVLGDVGRHARSAIGMAQLPLGACVEVEAIVKLNG
jgi:enamine deaminase RidA (YjgF/YER057c/UK114 family)